MRTWIQVRALSDHLLGCVRNLRLFAQFAAPSGATIGRADLIVDRHDNERRAAATAPTICALCAAWPPRRPRRSWARAPSRPPRAQRLRHRFAGRRSGRGSADQTTAAPAGRATALPLALTMNAHGQRCDPRLIQGGSRAPHAPARAPRCLRRRFAGRRAGARRGRGGAAVYTCPRAVL